MDGNRTEKEAGDGAAGEESPTVVETNSEPNNVPAAPPEEAYKPLQKNLAILALGIGLILFTLDATLVTTALPTIARELDGAETYSWIGTAYLLSATALAPLWGRFMDVFGRKSVLVFNCVLFTVISIPLAMAPSMNVLILCRAIQGIGGGGLQAGTFVVVSEVVSMRERGKYQGMMMALSGISAVVGPLLGGVLTDKLSWRWCFWLNLPFGFISCLLFILFIKNLSHPSSMREKLARIDYLGCFLCVVGVVLLLLGFTWSSDGWTSGKCLGSLLGGLAVLVIFGFWEAYGAKEPAVPMFLFKQWNFAWCSVAMFCMGWVMLGQNTFVPFYFQLVRGLTPTSSGLVMIPQIVSWLLGSIFVGSISSRTGRYVEFPKVGFAIMSVGIGVMGIWGIETGWAAIYGIEVVVGFGLALSITMLTLIVQASLDPKDIGPGTTIGTFLRSVGGTVSIAVSSAVLQSVVTNEYTAALPGLAEQGITPAVAGSWLSSVTSGTAPPGGLNATQIGALHGTMGRSYERGMQMVFIALVPFGVIGWIASLFLKHIPLSTKATGFATRKAGDKSGYGREDREADVVPENGATEMEDVGARKDDKV